MSTLTVELGERSYPIHIEAGLLSQSGLFASYIKGPLAVIVTNETVAPLYLEKAKRACGDVRVETIVLPDGEQHKNLAQFEVVMTRLLELNAARDTTLIALGGGVIGDLCGFVAATYQRGVPFIQVPTTLLSQVDSSVGGKTAVNHPLGKNMIGAFYQPVFVAIDTDSLTTLPEREFAAGMAEVIKYGIIYDAPFFAWLEAHIDALKALDTHVLSDTIKRCCEIKAEVVAKDEKEGGLRAILNLGHTFGHAIEAEQGYGNWLHGEAVAAGTILACLAAEQLGWFTSSETRRVRTLMSAFSLPVEGPSNMGMDDYVKHMKRDKKVEAGNIRFVLPKGMGTAVVTKDVTNDILANIL
ncbi:3-dehydroquinate synthase [Alteromonas australica]|jgi:3-dehydroquinate synthase|uniref:3-dehydroquinate synthase n=1 Tax=Alteromonas TaxID=226 RepID=UPI0005C4083A|nr:MULTISPECIES: 3-dehydroquinate synthase [Alteromonas]AJP42709.1 3-dehydroquinate synthase [Alteromonas australica]QPL49680.1 3-dehydroquinate synthase [Alteromonas sp. B31-7]|tara:strand:- start:34155 stop:35219 length:1065 start_codon:yes stop_codon:yes gene_type:complete